MRNLRFIIRGRAVGAPGLALAAGLLASGCDSDIKKSGTKLEMTPAQKAEIEDMRSAMADQKAERLKGKKAPSKGK